MVCFAGQRTISTILLRPTSTSPAHQHWLNVMASIQYVTTISYAEFATAAGVPNAVSAAGTACATNKMPINYPYHRIVHKMAR